MKTKMTLTLMSRSYCSLCNKMQAALQPFLIAEGIALDVQDVDKDDALLEKYDELVPVLLHGDTEICHYHLDKAKLTEYLAALR